MVKTKKNHFFLIEIDINIMIIKKYCPFVWVCVCVTLIYDGFNEPYSPYTITERDLWCGDEMH